jgi:hypothetical protein
MLLSSEIHTGSKKRCRHEPPIKGLPAFGDMHFLVEKIKVTCAIHSLRTVESNLHGANESIQSYKLKYKLRYH